MARWDYHEEHLDFSLLTIPHLYLVYLGGNIGFPRTQDDVPISKIKFYYRNFTGFSNEVEMKYQAWQLIQPLIQQRVNELSAQRWELTTPLSPSLVHTINGGRFPDGLLILICIIFFPLIFVLLIYMMIFGSDYFVYVSADLPFRRYIP